MKAHFVRAGFVAFGAQSYDFEVQFDSASAAFQDMFDLRHSVGLAIIQRFNEDGIALAYPTQSRADRRGSRDDPAQASAQKIKEDERDDRQAALVGRPFARIRSAARAAVREIPPSSKRQQGGVAARAEVVSTDTARSATKR